MKLIIDIPEKTIAHIRSDYGHGYKGLYGEDREIIATAIYTGKPCENIHGEWETRYEIIRNPWGEEHNPQTKCSNCNFRVDTHSSGFMNFCPNCGADMRGKAK